MGYLSSVLIVILVLSTFMFTFTVNEARGELRKLPVKGDTDRKD